MRNGLNLVIVSVILLLTLASCGTGARHNENNLDSLRTMLLSLDTGCLDFSNLYQTIKEIDHNKIIDRHRNSWLFDLEKIDANKFERADDMTPVCKLFENEETLAIVFVDWYDYKQALHVFTFQKPEIDPVSSFILFSIGGDGEAFWNTECTRLDKFRYQLTDEQGYFSFNDLEALDTTFIDHRVSRVISIDKYTGALEKKFIKEERNIIEIPE